MKKLYVFMFICFGSMASLRGQEDLPYAEIPEAPAEYTGVNLMGRLLDGLGFRYYWATEGLEEKDLDFVPQGADARSMRETLSHLYGLANTIAHTVEGKVLKRPGNPAPESFDQMRNETLLLLHKASKVLKEEEGLKLSERSIRFKRGDQVSEFPFWNLINGPIADALYHTGQIVVFRRGAGNPIHPGVNVFLGKKMSR